MAREGIETAISRTLSHQLQQGMLWVPVLLGIGISIYFRLQTEPAAWVAWVGLFCFGIFVTISIIIKRSFNVLILAFGIICLGFTLSMYRTIQVAEPVLGWRYYGPVEGTVVGLDKSGSGRPRVTLANPTMGRISKPRTPAKIRVSLYGEGEIPKPGQRVSTTASFSPPTGPSEPRGYNFQKRAWFQSLGAVGYSRKPLILIEEANNKTWRLRIFDFRVKLSSALRSYMPEIQGGFAAAILTGDRAYVDPSSLKNLRHSNLAHLLAISGLHMGLMTGVVFLFVRTAFALIPRIALRIPTKKIAALVALCAGFSYLLISGSAVATERAFIMVAVMMGAILFDRPAISLRAVAIAATLILSLWPENLLEPGFQMSFAATTALVIAFRRRTGFSWWQKLMAGKLKFAKPVFGLAFSSLVAGMATAPFAAYHFNQIPHYGLIANMSSLPIMGMIVMPSALIAVVLTPFGLQAGPLWVMGIGISWILGVAEWVSGLGGAVSLVPQSDPNTLLFMVMGCILVFLLSKYQKLIGISLICIAMFGWLNADRPDVLVTGNGRLVGVLTDETRALNRKRGNGFSAKTWLENDGMMFDQAINAAAFDDDVDNFVQTVATDKIMYLWEKDTLLKNLLAYCNEHAVVIAPKWEERFDDGPCEFWGKKRLRYDGALSFQDYKGSMKIETARQVNGRRLWNSYSMRKERGYYSIP